MAANAEPETTPTTENAEELGRIQKAWNETVETLSTRFKDIEQKVSESAAKVGSKLGLGELAKKAEEQSKTRFESLKATLKLDELIERVGKVGSKGVELSEEALEKFGLLRADDLDGVKAELDELTKKVETLRKKVSGLASKKELEKLVKKVTKLEKSAKAE